MTKNEKSEEKNNCQKYLDILGCKLAGEKKNN